MPLSRGISISKTRPLAERIEYCRGGSNEGAPSPCAGPSSRNEALPIGEKKLIAVTDLVSLVGGIFSALSNNSEEGDDKR